MSEQSKKVFHKNNVAQIPHTEPEQRALPKPTLAVYPLVGGAARCAEGQVKSHGG